MQLKTIGESLGVTKTINDIISKTAIMSKSMSGFKLQTIQLSEGLKNYSTEAIKTAICQSTLNETQIRAILLEKGLTGETLETTTAELVQVTSTNALSASQEAATATTMGFGNAMKGLGVSIKNLMSAHPVLLAITAAISAVMATVTIIDVCTTSFDELKDKISELKQEVSASQSEMDSISTQLDEVNKKIQDIQSLGTLTFIEEGELKNLQEQKTELESLYNIEKARHDLAQSDLEKTAKDYLNKTSMSEYKTETYTQKQMKNGQFADVRYTQAAKTTKLEEMNAAAYEMLEQQGIIDKLNSDYENIENPSDKQTKEYEKNLKATEKARDEAKKTALDIQKEAQEQVEDLDETSESYKSVLEASQYLSDMLALLNNDFKALSEDSKKNYLKKNVKFDNRTTQKEFNNFVDELNSDELNILADISFDENTTVKEIRKALAKAQGEADENYVTIESQFKSSDYEESSNKSSSTATIADLQSEADTLALIKREISDTGKIGISSMQNIIEQFPEAKGSLEKYRLGIISVHELFEILTNTYALDEVQYKNSVNSKIQATNDFWNSIITDNQSLQTTLTSFYGDDWTNWKNLAQAKKETEAQLIYELGAMWTKYYESQITAFQIIKNADDTYSIQDNTNAPVVLSEKTLKGNIGITGYANKQLLEQQNSERQKIEDVINKYNYAIKKINDTINSATPEFTTNTSWEELSGYNSDSSSTSQTAQKFNWIERLINKISNAYSRLKNAVSNTSDTWLNRNNALSDSIQVLISEIDAQSKAYDYYMDLYNSYGLDEYYKNQIANGSISIEVIYDDNLKEAIDECQNLYDNAQEAKDAVDELTQEYRSLAKTRFDNLKSEYEAQLGLIEDTVEILTAQQTLLETEGYINSKYLYNSLLEAEKENLENLNAEYAALSSKINNVEEGSENWYSMKTDINSVSEAIINATNSLKGYENEIRQIEWDMFDRTRDDVADLIDESDFMYGLLEDKGLYDDGGDPNRYGQAAQAMLAQKYELYALQSKAYADEIKKLDSELTENPYDTALLDRKQELIKLQQESVQSALDEKNALKDLISDGYEEYKNSLDEIIGKYKEMLSVIKDTYDYEKNIEELTDNLAALEKQYQAYQGDDSESGRKNVRQLKTELEEARQNLKETEYEKLISDTEKLLDEFQTDVEEWLNKRLDNLDELIGEVISQSNAATEEIAGTINEAAASAGYTLSENMNGIWAVYSGNITNALSETGNKFTSGQSALHETVKNISDGVMALLKYADEEAAKLAAVQSEQENKTAAGSDTGSRTEYSADTWESPFYGGGSAETGGDSGSSDWSIYKYYYPQDLNVDTSVVDRLKSNNIDASYEARSRYWEMLIGDGEYYSTYEQNERLLNWLKNNGYAKGSRRILFDQLGLTQERGQELIYSKSLGGMITPLRRGDKVFTSEMSENLWKLAQKPVVPDVNSSGTLPYYIGQQNMSNDVKVSFGDVSVELPNVKNYTDFMKEAQKDPDFSKMVQNIALGQAFGKNTYERYVYK